MTRSLVKGDANDPYCFLIWVLGIQPRKAPLASARTDSRSIRAPRFAIILYSIVAVGSPFASSAALAKPLKGCNILCMIGALN